MKFPLLRFLPCFGLLWLVSLGFSAGSVTVDLSSEKQTIRGFGGMIHTVWQGYDLNASDRDLAFGNGPGQIGLTVLRIPVYDQESNWKRELATAKDVISRGGIVYASPWTPPQSLRTPYSFNRWGTTYNSHKISSSNYAAYAAHLNKFAKYMKDNGAPLYAISIQNEPDWCDSWTCWSADEVYNFVKSTAADLREHGTKVITPESFSYDKNYHNKILNDANALKNIDIIGAHFYGSTAASGDNFFQYALADQKATDKERWMTEHYTDSKGNANLWRGYIITGDQDQAAKYDTVRALDVAYEIHRGLVEGNFNQYTWWYIRRNYGLIMHDGANNVKPPPSSADAGKVSKRGYCMAQFAKFVRPGAVRVEATKHPDTHVYVSAYKNPDSVMIVAVNRSSETTVEFKVPAGTGITSWKKYTTSETKNVNDDGSVTATNGTFSASLDKESVTTFVGLRVTIPQAPYSGTPIAIPGQIEVEDYDVGGEGTAFHDEEAENKDGAYRTDGVDITGDSTAGFKVSWTIAGEWLEYTVDVETAKSYTWEAKVASGGDGSAFHLMLGETDITGTIDVPNTGDWETYTTVTGTTTELPAGEQILKLVVDGSYFNIDWIKISDAPTPILLSNQGANSTQEYKIFSLLGAYVGSVKLQDTHGLQEHMKQIVSQPGMYLVKSKNHGNSFLIRIEE